MSLSLDTLKNVTNADLALAMSILGSTVSCGALTIFLYDQDLFLTLEISKLIILSTSITAPVLVYNSFVFQALYNRNSAIRGNITGGGYVAIPVLCAAILGKYFFDYSVGIYIALVLAMELLFTILISFEFSKKHS